MNCVLPVLLVTIQWGTRLDMGRKPGTRVQETHFVTEYMDGFGQVRSLWHFSRFFGRQFIGEIAFVRLQAIVQKRFAIQRRGFLACNRLVGALAGILLRFAGRQPCFLCSPFLAPFASFSETRFFLR